MTQTELNKERKVNCLIKKRPVFSGTDYLQRATVCTQKCRYPCHHFIFSFWRRIANMCMANGGGVVVNEWTGFGNWALFVGILN